MTRKTNNFTLVEIIAVLLIIAIMAAVAAPKFVSIATEARLGVAQAGINEAKATLSVAYHKAYLTAGGGAVTGANVLTATGLTSPVDFGDIEVTMVVDGTYAQKINRATTTVDGVAAVVTDSWTVPVQ